MMKKFAAYLLAGLLLLSLLTGCAVKEPLAAVQEYYEGTEVLSGFDVLAPAFARAGVTGWEDGYRASVLAELERGGGELPGATATDYARAVIGLTAAGFHAQKLDGCDLTMFFADSEFVHRQGLNGAVFTLLALDCGGYSLPEDADVDRTALLSTILEQELPGGGFCYRGDTADPDMTAMVLMALAPYQEQEEIRSASERCISVLSGLQEADGGFSSWGSKNCESCAQVMLAMCELGIGMDDPRFVKNGKTVLDAMLEYQRKDGGFAHMDEKDSNAIATAQAYTALLALQLHQSGGGRYYDFAD